MFDLTQGGGVLTAMIGWLLVFSALFAANEITRRFKWVGFIAFVVMPIALSVIWFTILKATTYLDWFHLVKVYSSTAGCILFWCIRFVGGTKKDGSKWRLADKKWFLFLVPIILAINILEACVRDFQIGQMAISIPTAVDGLKVFSGPWNYMNGIAGLLNIVTITGWFVVLPSEKRSKKMAARICYGRICSGSGL